MTSEASPLQSSLLAGQNLTETRSSKQPHSSSSPQEAAVAVISNPGHRGDDSTENSSSRVNVVSKKAQRTEDAKAKSSEEESDDGKPPAKCDKTISDGMDEEEGDEEYEEQWKDNEVITAAEEQNANSLDGVPIPRKSKKRRVDALADDYSENDNDDPVDVSLNDLKRHIMGRDLRQETDEEEEEEAELEQVRALMNTGPLSRQNSTAGPNTLCDKLSNDMTCAICHDIFYPPMSLLCGHTFCQPCLEWWLGQANSCPTCRHVVSREQAPRTPNLALRACVMTMFGKEIVARLQSKRSKGERGGAHAAGYQVVVSLEDDRWRCVETSRKGNDNSETLGTLKVRRNIVLDADDQRMQLALAIHRPPTKVVVSADSGLNVKLCMLRMEEDEVEDSGFPITLTAAEDEAFICSHESQFLSSFVEVKMRDENGHLSPLSRVPCGTNGFFNCSMVPTQSAGHPIDARALLFEHSETSTQLEIDFSQLQTRASCGSLQPPSMGRSNRNMGDTEGDEAEDQSGFVMGQSDYSDCEGDEDKFEDDGFVVHDGESNSDNDGEFSEEEDDECCCICKEGGEVMVCDGGCENEGCKKYFHAGCVERDTVPEGDWVCQACAQSGGVEAGPEGYEFSDMKKSLFSDASQSLASGPYNRRAFADDNDDDSCEQKAPSDDDVEEQPKTKINPTKRKRMVLEDSDSD